MRRMSPPSPRGNRQDSGQGHDAAAPLAVTTRSVEPTAVVITVHGEIDMSNRTVFQDRLMAQIRQDGPHVIVDLTAVDHLGAAALTVLLTVQDRVRASGGRGMSIIACTPAVLLPLTAAGLIDFFDVHPELARVCAG